ncbi:hypothetical protein [uncultured Empedobacter sp.]|uniref:hypothetical protein n=1 Tax=uncultured Empedobacter sp. TaxID=410844 RepID=UPI0025F6CC66|nr:hypothetical protein [uncultured Empedobacter sp.]
MKTKTHLGELDLEVLNPIETKKIIGGNWYDYDYHDIPEVIIDGGGGGYDGGGWGGWGYDPTHGGGDYGGDYGGGGSGSTGGGDPHTVSGLPTTVEQQIGGACVSFAIAFAATANSHALTGAQAALQIAMGLNLNLNTVLNTGLTFAQTIQAVNTVLDTHPLMSNVGAITGAIDNNNVVIGNLDPSSNVGHEVVIVGYDNTAGTFTVADSQTGTYHDVAQGDINLYGGLFEITGVK